MDLSRALAVEKFKRRVLADFQQLFKLSAICIIFPVRRPVEDLLSRHQRPEFVDHIVRFDVLISEPNLNDGYFLLLSRLLDS